MKAERRTCFGRRILSLILIFPGAVPPVPKNGNWLRSGKLNPKKKKKKKEMDDETMEKAARLMYDPVTGTFPHSASSLISQESEDRLRMGLETSQTPENLSPKTKRFLQKNASDLQNFGEKLQELASECKTITKRLCEKLANIEKSLKKEVLSIRSEVTRKGLNYNTKSFLKNWESIVFHPDTNIVKKICNIRDGKQEEGNKLIDGAKKEVHDCHIKINKVIDPKGNAPGETLPQKFTNEEIDRIEKKFLEATRLVNF
jgi:hypothetical protein